MELRAHSVIPSLRPFRLSRWLLRLGLLSGGLALGLGACIIEERVFDSHLAACDEYCRLMAADCPRAYDRPAACQAVCMLMDEGDELGGGSENTVACRLRKMRSQGFEPVTECRQVGPGSDGDCSDNCTALCNLRGRVCGTIPGQSNLPDVASLGTCLRDCAALADIGSLDAERDEHGDNVQCRLVHISEAALSRQDALAHCQHTQIIPEPGENTEVSSPCSDPPALPLQQECQTYCGIVTVACSGELAVYASEEQCLQACNLMTPGEPGDLNGDTIRCRRYHSYSALSEPATHCMHAGPTGDGHCGTSNCPGYCRALRQGCPNEFAAVHGSGDEILSMNGCEQACASFEDADTDQFRDLPPRYNGVTSLPGNTLKCRTFHAVQALGARNDPLHCAAAFGEPGTECQ